MNVKNKLECMKKKIKIQKENYVYIIILLALCRNEINTFSDVENQYKLQIEKYKQKIEELKFENTSLKVKRKSNENDYNSNNNNSSSDNNQPVHNEKKIKYDNRSVSCIPTIDGRRTAPTPSTESNRLLYARKNPSKYSILYYFNIYLVIQISILKELLLEL